MLLLMAWFAEVAAAEVVDLVMAVEVEDKKEEGEDNEEE